ncbi:MAG: hypothetical protein AAFY26_01960 [Cyanobacteria bacterium J06638_22]
MDRELSNADTTNNAVVARSLDKTLSLMDKEKKLMRFLSKLLVRILENSATSYQEKTLKRFQEEDLNRRHEDFQPSEEFLAYSMAALQHPFTPENRVCSGQSYRQNLWF